MDYFSHFKWTLSHLWKYTHTHTTFCMVQFPFGIVFSNSFFPPTADLWQYCGRKIYTRICWMLSITMPIDWLNMSLFVSLSRSCWIATIHWKCATLEKRTSLVICKWMRISDFLNIWISQASINRYFIDMSFCVCVRILPPCPPIHPRMFLQMAVFIGAYCCENIPIFIHSFCLPQYSNGE